MKIKNFVILSVVVVLFFGGGCASIKTGDNSFEYGTFPLGGNASATKIIISNNTSGLMDVFWDNVKINREKDRMTYKPIKPGEIFLYANNTAWVGETVVLTVQIWDKTHSRLIYSRSETFPVHFQRGVVSISWVFYVDHGNRKIRNDVDYRGLGGGFWY